VVRLNPSGNNYSIAYSTYLGGASADLANGIAIDASENAYVVGQSASAGLGTPGAAQQNKGSVTDAFVAKFNQSGAKTYFTYIGGTGGSGQAALDAATGVAVDASGAAYVADTPARFFHDKFSEDIQRDDLRHLALLRFFCDRD
jgi:hypothetical protein